MVEKIEGSGLKRITVLVGIPTTRPWVNTGLYAFQKILVECNANPKVPWHFDFHNITGNRGVAFARNQFIKLMRENEELDKLWFWDQDVVPSKQSMELLVLEADIAAGIYPAFQSKEFTGNETEQLFYGAYHRNEAKEWIFSDIDPEGSPIQNVEGVMMGCTVLDGKMLRDKRMDYHEPVKDIPCVFKDLRSPNGRHMGTEDLDFCSRAVDLGYKVQINRNVRCGHLKEMDMEIMSQFGKTTWSMGYEEAKNDMQKGNLIEVHSN